MQMHNPAHPGEVIRESCLKPLGIMVTAAAAGLGVTRKALSDLSNGHTGVSPEMAIRLEDPVGRGGLERSRRMASNAGCAQPMESATPCDKIKVRRFPEPHGA
jgi:antitoxin HigA-1